MIKFITSNKSNIEVQEIMGKVNYYLKFQDDNYLKEEEKKFLLQDQLNNCKRKLEQLVPLHEIRVKDNIIPSTGKFKYIKIWIKKLVRKMVAWYVHGIAIQQTQFNVKTIENLIEMQDLLQMCINENRYLKNELDVLKDEMSGIGLFEGAGYKVFEDQFRGAENVIRKRDLKYIPYFQDKKMVIDLGCGRGEFVELLKENGIEGIGVDLNEEMLEDALNKKLCVKKMDCIEYLETLEDDSIGGIYGGQLVEHLSLSKRCKLLELAYHKLCDDGILILESVNPLTLGVFSYGFYTDPTHTIPVHPATLRFIAEQVGFYVDPIGFAEEFPESYKFAITEDMSEGTQKAFEKLNNQLFGAQDYYIVCRKKGEHNE